MKTLLVCVDFSETTDVVINTAVAVASAFKSKVFLLHVAAPDPDFVTYEPGPQSERDSVAEHLREDHRRLQALEARLTGEGLDATAMLVQGATAGKILEEVGRVHADWVVMGSHGHGAVYELLVGSVTDAVVRKAVCPVLVVPSPR